MTKNTAEANTPNGSNIRVTKDNMARLVHTGEACKPRLNVQKNSPSILYI